MNFDTYHVPAASGLHHVMDARSLFDIDFELTTITID